MNVKKPKIIVSGAGSVTLEFGYKIKANIKGYFKLAWDLFKNIYIKFYIYGDWIIIPYFYAKLSIDYLQLEIRRLLIGNYPNRLYLILVLFLLHLHRILN